MNTWSGWLCTVHAYMNVCVQDLHRQWQCMMKIESAIAWCFVEVDGFLVSEDYWRCLTDVNVHQSDGMWDEAVSCVVVLACRDRLFGGRSKPHSDGWWQTGWSQCRAGSAGPGLQARHHPGWGWSLTEGPPLRCRCWCKGRRMRKRPVSVFL